jgi:MFS family permease
VIDIEPSEPALEPGASRADKIVNIAICVTASAGIQVGMAFMNFGTILPLLLGHLGARNWVVGGVVSLFSILFSIGGLASVKHVRRRPRIRRIVFRLALLERSAFMPLIFLIPLWAMPHPQWLIGAIFACVGMHGFSLGMNQPAYWSVVGKVTPLGWRGKQSGIGGGIAGLLGFGVYAITHHLLSGPNDGFPDAFSTLYLIGSIIIFVTGLPLGRFREPVRPIDLEEDAARGPVLHDALDIWRSHPAFRRFLCAIACIVLATLSMPFYMLHALRALHAGHEAAGYAAVPVIAAAFGSIGAGAWSDRAGNRVILITGVAFVLLANVAALAVKSSLLFYAVFIFSSISMPCINIAANNIVIEFAPAAHDIPLFNTLYNLVMALPRAAAPLLGGLIADVYGGYGPSFSLSIVLALAGLYLALRVPEPRRAASRSVAVEPA